MPSSSRKRARRAARRLSCSALTFLSRLSNSCDRRRTAPVVEGRHLFHQSNLRAALPRPAKKGLAQRDVILRTPRKATR